MKSYRFVALLLLVGVLGLGACKSKRDLASGTDAPPVKNLPMLDTHWEFVSLEEKEIYLPEGVTEPPFMLLQSENRFTGRAGCNTLMGTYKLEGPRLDLTRVASTRKYCADERVMEQERNLMEALRQVKSFEISGAKLTLFNGERRLAELKAKSQ
jgi:heat shock protein HslJ